MTTLLGYMESRLGCTMWDLYPIQFHSHIQLLFHIEILCTYNCPAVFTNSYLATYIHSYVRTSIIVTYICYDILLVVHVIRYSYVCTIAIINDKSVRERFHSFADFTSFMKVLPNIRSTICLNTTRQNQGSLKDLPRQSCNFPDKQERSLRKI